MQFSDDLPAVDFVDLMHGQGAMDIDSHDDRHICATCLPDRGIADAIAYFADGQHCDFCGRRYRSERCAPIHEVAQFVIGCLRQDYDTPENTLLLDSESESGFAGHVFDKWELLGNHLEADWEAFEAIAECVTDDHYWCEGDPALFLPHRQLASSWESFSRYVKHRSRFMFLRADEQPRSYLDGPDDTYVPARHMLDLVGDAVIAGGLIRTLGTSTKIYRARAVKKGRPWHQTASDLGPPPESDSGPPAGRMNPAGIPIFYGALEIETALNETLESSGRVAVGTFSPARPLKILDLARRDPLPYRSIFENVTASMRGLRNFVEAFRDDIAKVTARDGREHIDYVPAQIVTEYFRRVFLVGEEDRLDGIMYPSTRSPSGRNVALFLSREGVEGIGRRDPVLRFRPRSTHRFMVTARKGKVTKWKSAGN